MTMSRVTGLLILGLFVGCSGTQQKTDQTSKKQVRTSQIKEIWEACFMDGINAGYIHTKTTPLKKDGEVQIETRITLSLNVVRDGQKTNSSATIIQLSKPDGEFLSFVCTNSTGVTITGQVKKGQLILKTKAGSNTSRSAVKWDPKTGGCLADREHLKKGMKPGERKTLKLVNPILANVTKIELEALDYESTKLLGDERSTEKLLKVRQVSEIPTGNPQKPFRLETIHWVDPSGEVLKSYIPSIGQETYRTSRAVAVARESDEKFDLARASVVKVKQKLAKPHLAKRIVYRVRLKHNDPAKVFATGVTQRVIQVHDNRTADIEVVAATLSGPPRLKGEVTAHDRTSNAIIESSDVGVQRLAARVDGQGTVETVAKKLEKLVNQSIRGDRRNYTQAFLRASEVAKRLEGDCTEHSVLLAALCRVHKIPARVASGLVYSESAGGFAFHMWNEVWMKDRWYPLDATLALGGIGAAHLKINDSNLSGATPFGSILPVMQVFRQIELEILTVEH